VADEWRVEVDLGEEGHLTLGERLRSLDLDDTAQDRLGGKVIVTRDGDRMFLYARSQEAATEAERVVRELLEAEGLDAEVEVTRWDARDHEWEHISGAAEEAAREGDEHEPAVGVPVFVFLGAHKPKFLRDLGL
jgi:hypothetical protein